MVEIDALSENKFCDSDHCFTVHSTFYFYIFIFLYLYNELLRYYVCVKQIVGTKSMSFEVLSYMHSWSGTTNLFFII